MAQDDQDRNGKIESRAAPGASTWPVGGSRAPWANAWGALGRQSQFVIPARLRDWAALEAGAGRLLPWLAVAYAAGIVLYFTAEREPAVWASLALAAIAGAIAFAARRTRLG
ncbi:MAG TPA: competence protein ComEC, partial [Xanthobacteraceae bacterium]|nr:competence protein ComEC [Xanthobacteraceae bacterium]